MDLKIDETIELDEKPKKVSKTSTLAKYWVSIAIIVSATIAAAVLINLLTDLDFVQPISVVVRRPKPPVYYAKLSGIQVENQTQVNAPVTAIMIENSPAARPQSGLAAAEVVFEAIAEGGITRFLAIYQANRPQLIGPVRSVRPYYVSWVAPFNASVAHVGGSSKALAEIRNGKYRDIDQFFNGGSYWRSKDRIAPHNVYTNFERLNALNIAKGYTSSNPQMFARQEAKAAQVVTATKIDFKISSATYNSSYLYNQETNNYTRWQAGRPHLDREAGEIKVDAVIGLVVNETKILEDGWRENIETIGSNKAYIFQNGTITEATWKKADQFSQIHFYDTEGKEIAINRGKVWISAVSNSNGVTWQ